MNIKYNSKGFTLLEIVISLTILAFGFTAILSLFPIGFDAASRYTDLTKAAIYAQYVMEDKKRAGFPVAQVAAGTAFPVFSPPAFDARFTYGVTAAPSPPAATDNSQSVTVTVNWSYRGRNYAETFDTIIPRYNPPP